ncbi:hypothetical protein A8924_4571 [Saccharopolyspora erythraea NRRL 2338]|uniref:Uncharacterized protein n=2 Tax=Saccharopolyspora erythraea TaxID=1836 RepID=A4FHC2_SACEN|nr:hypothetical protein [Saccharopolyspora erythraea]EQD86852.1 hypothetical protein N599_07390 [Saccharopolyspora erythraea D]PFG97147.1 hypothetical protein A8924_4571 [Saccharopolyspora erythraea NRRL 2338]QRK87350.1 hypothetical protein JQX30_21310 [Saccharopolyspora erythraea]CAM03447.1 hypothetical protein SACE_4178 [Saccharopolyspora erythraea NRRL 2338]
MSVDLSSVVAATTRWLTAAYPASGGAFDRALAEAQAQQAVTVAASLRYPTPVDAALVVLAGPGGSARLDWLAGTEVHDLEHPDHAWRTWVDEVVASWACCLLADPALAARAVAALPPARPGVPAVSFGRLTEPGRREQNAAFLLRHPDLQAPVADLHRERLLELIEPDTSTAA